MLVYQRVTTLWFSIAMLNYRRDPEGIFIHVQPMSLQSFPLEASPGTTYPAKELPVEEAETERSTLFNMSIYTQYIYILYIYDYICVYIYIEICVDICRYNVYICIFCIYSTMCFFSKKRSPGSNALSSCCHSLPRLVRLAKSNMAHFNYKLAMAGWTYHFYAGCSLKKNKKCWWS